MMESVFKICSSMQQPHKKVKGRKRNFVSLPAGEFRGGYVLFEGGARFECRETPGLYRLGNNSEFKTTTDRHRPTGQKIYLKLKVRVCP
ncbi:MAG: hypothetical protein LBL44_11625 [Treponema sp.]|nr:hypothetical protein [Treponema sp.]